MSERKILVIGAGPLQIPAYSTARRLGVRSLAVDRNPSAPGMALADLPFVVDTGDFSSILRIAQEQQIDGIVTLCTDAPVRIVARVAERLGLCGISVEAAFRATHKGAMRDALLSGGVPVPAYRRCHSLEEVVAAAADIGFPVILKPTSSSGSRGVFRARMSTELERGYRHANAACPTEPFVLVEQFIEGPEVSVETLSFRGGHHVIAITDKRTSGDPHWVETGHVEPSRLTPIQQETISSCAKAALQALGVSNAAGHVEIKLGPGGPVLIELGARLGGDYITTELVHRSTGVDMVEAVIRIALGQKPDIRSTKNHGAAIRYLCSGVGRIKRFEGWEVARTMEGVKRAELSMHPGDQVSGGVSSVDRPGFIICEGASPAEAEARAEAAVAAVTIHLE